MPGSQVSVSGIILPLVILYTAGFLLVYLAHVLLEGHSTSDSRGNSGEHRVSATGHSRNRRPGRRRDEGVVCEACGETNEAGYTYCWCCVAELPSEFGL